MRTHLRSEYNLRLVVIAATLVFVFGRARQTEGFVPHDRWYQTATGISSFRGAPITLTWSIVPDGTTIDGGGTSGLVEMLDNHFDVANRSEPLGNRPWKWLFDSAFSRWGEVGGVSFHYESFDDGAMHKNSPGTLLTRGDIRFAAESIDGSRGILASSQYPDGGDITIDIDGPGYLLDPAGDYLRFRNTLMHEIGHSLGLDHLVSSDAQLLMEPVLSLDFEGPQLDDVRGLHYLYGDRFEKSGNNTLDQATPLGTLLRNESIFIGSDAGMEQALTPSSTDFLSISGQSDADYYRFTTDESGLLSVVLSPVGGRFRQAAVGDVELLTNAAASSNLNLALIDSNGNSLALVDDTLHGSAEYLFNYSIEANSAYYIRVRGTRDTVQLYTLNISHQQGILVPEPLTETILLASLFCTYFLHRLRCHRRVLPTRLRSQG